MRKIQSLVRVWYPLLISIVIIIISSTLHYQFKDHLISLQIKELHLHANYINSFIQTPLSSEQLNSAIKQLHTENMHINQLIILGKDNYIYHCMDKSLSQTDCSKKINADELKYYDEAIMANNNPNKIGYQVKLKKTSDSVIKKNLHFTKNFKQFYLFLTISYNNITNSLAEIDLLLIIFSIIIIIIVVLSNYSIYFLLIKPVKQITSSLSNFYKEGLETRLNYSNIEEIAKLQYELNRVASEIQKQMDELEFRRDQVVTIIRNMSEGVIILNEELRIMIFNDGLFTLLKTNPEFYNRVIEGRFYYEVIRNNSINELIEQSYTEKKRLTKNIQPIGLDNVVLEVICIPISHKEGMVILISNITEQYKLIEIKKSFVENASHEFKTPISIIKGYIETLLKTDDIPLENQKAFLEKILRNADRLNNLIKDLITLNKLDESKNYFKTEQVNITDAIENCLDILSLKAEAKGITLKNTISQEKIEIMGNPELFETIFFNLIDNGITYTEMNGVVSVHYERKNNSIHFMIRDNGIGISSEHRERIFERFYRIDEGRSRKSGGTGLGLSIVKHAVTFHNGNIICEENPTGFGTQFQIIFPDKILLEEKYKEYEYQEEEEYVE